MPNSPTNNRPSRKPAIPESVRRQIQQSRADDAARISSLHEEIEGANEALRNAWADNQRLTDFNARLIDNSAIKDRALKYAFRAFWLIPLIAWLVIAIVIWGEICVWDYCRKFYLPDLALVTLITGSFVVMITILGLVLKGVFNSKLDLESSPASQLLDILQKLGGK